MVSLLPKSSKKFGVHLDGGKERISGEGFLFSLFGCTPLLHIVWMERKKWKRKDEERKDCISLIWLT